MKNYSIIDAKNLGITLVSLQGEKKSILGDFYKNP